MRVLTTDVYAGAWLLTRGGRLVDLLVDCSGGRSSGTFVFEGPDLLAAHETYSRGEAIANVKDIRDGVTTLRGRLAHALRQAA